MPTKCVTRLVILTIDRRAPSYRCCVLHGNVVVVVFDVSHVILMISFIVFVIVLINNNQLNHNVLNTT